MAHYSRYCTSPAHFLLKLIKYQKPNQPEVVFSGHKENAPLKKKRIMTKMAIIIHCISWALSSSNSGMAL